MTNDFTLSAYSYDLPPENIAQKPADQRDNSQLLVLHKESNKIEHKYFADITQYISDKDMLVVNDTKVFPARLLGKKATGGKAEVFLLNYPSLSKEKGFAEVQALIKSSKKPKPGAVITISSDLRFKVLESLEGGKANLELRHNPSKDLSEILADCGQVPLPPYISREGGTTDEDVKRYQTVYANQPGAVAAPTAGLHFTEDILTSLENRGVLFGTVTLHVGYGTFAPVRAEKIQEHAIHEEFMVVPKETVEKIEKVKQRGGKVWAVGTTTVRALEFAAKEGTLQPMEGWCNLYIYPGFQFKVIDNLITNFHLPESSLMFLVSALCSREQLLHCYNTAIQEGYRFYSYGDAMAIIGE